MGIGLALSDRCRSNVFPFVAYQGYSSVKHLLLCEIFVVEGEMIVEISVNFRPFHSENMMRLSGQERSFQSVLSSSSSEDCSPSS
jgi:hypothetical protein